MEKAYGSPNVCFVDCTSHNTHAFQRKRLRDADLARVNTHPLRQNTLEMQWPILGSSPSKSVLSGGLEQNRNLFVAVTAGERRHESSLNTNALCRHHAAITLAVFALEPLQNGMV